ncbi:hypothetical protein [Microterricola viridarii]|uniref:Uncharacterized protein n=1 Tax=Microterricola viridarii TaxID=412690 RepID=A0A1H1Z8R5_9MICO|nr:hypothetical protein [Microterricola viridarii]SDT30235.1 hypothetical protein SAMN04489834_3367 [Microterricola viridarii]
MSAEPPGPANGPESDAAAREAAGTVLVRVRSGLITEESVYGIVLVSGMIVVAGGYGATSWETFLGVIGTVVVFWAAHVYAGTVAGHGVLEGDETTLAGAFHRAVGRSLGFLLAALLPCFVLLLGALKAIDDSVAMWTALWLGVVVLGVLGFSAFTVRGSSWPVRIAGALGTAAFGFAMIALKAIIH